MREEIVTQAPAYVILDVEHLPRVANNHVSLISQLLDLTLKDGLYSFDIREHSVHRKQ